MPLFSNGKFVEYTVSPMMDLHSAEAGLAGGEGETAHRQEHGGGWKTGTRRRCCQDPAATFLQTQLGDFPGFMCVGLKGDKEIPERYCVSLGTRLA